MTMMMMMMYLMLYSVHCCSCLTVSSIDIHKRTAYVCGVIKLLRFNKQSEFIMSETDRKEPSSEGERKSLN
jgi:hypothetical protein